MDNKSRGRLESRISDFYMDIHDPVPCQDELCPFDFVEMLMEWGYIPTCNVNHDYLSSEINDVRCFADVVYLVDILEESGFVDIKKGA